MIYDLIIIGGGMSGISVGHHFRDQNILILERGELLSEASGKNAGFVISGFGEHFSRTAARWGVERACEIQDIHLANHAMIREYAAQMACAYKQTGSLALADSEREQDDLRQSCSLMQERGYPVEWLNQPSTGLRENRGALLIPMDAHMDPRLFWSHLAEGLPVQTHCEVREVKNLPDSIQVITSTGNLHAHRVVYCLNAFAADLVPELHGRYIPLRGQIVELLLRDSAPTECPIYTAYGDIYWRFSGGKIIFGGLEHLVPEHETGIASGVSAPILEAQKRWISENFREGLIASEPAIPRCSTMAFTVDGFPFVGRLPEENRYVLSGLCGLGHGYAMQLASWLRELIVDGRSHIPVFCSSDRIKSLPVYTGGDWRTLYEAWNH